MNSQVLKAVTALLELQGKKEKQTGIVEEPEKIDLQFVFKKIPALKNKTIKLCLPQSIHHDSREVCIFVKDLDSTDREYEPTIRHFQDLLAKKGIASVSKIVPMKALRTDYTVNSAKISLAKAYDLYLADERIIGFLPGCLGKIFYAKKSTRPVQVNLKATDLKKEIDSAVNNSRCIISGKGSDCMAAVAHCKMAKDDIVQNIIEAIDQITAAIPGGLPNIRSLHIKTPDSMAIPLYYSAGSGDEVSLPRIKEEKLKEFVDDVTTVMGSKVKVRADGVIQVLGQQPDFMSMKKHPGKGRKAKLRKISQKSSGKFVSRRENKPDTKSGKKKAVKRKAEDSVPDISEKTRSVSKKGKRKAEEESSEIEKHIPDQIVTVKSKKKDIEDTTGKDSKRQIESISKSSKQKVKGRKGRPVPGKVVKLKSLKK